MSDNVIGLHTKHRISVLEMIWDLYFTRPLLYSEGGLCYTTKHPGVSLDWHILLEVCVCCHFTCMCSCVWVDVWQYGIIVVICLYESQDTMHIMSNSYSIWLPVLFCFALFAGYKVILPSHIHDTVADQIYLFLNMVYVQACTILYISICKCFLFFVL